MPFRFRPLIGAALAVLIAASGAAAALLVFSGWPRREAAPPKSISIGGPFILVASDGKTVTDQSYRGKWLLVYFGCTRCSDTSSALAAMSEALRQLGVAANQIQPLFITIDPKRDSPEALARYMTSFDRRIVGLTGTAEQIATAAREYRVYYAPEDTLGGLSVVPHSSFVYLVNPEGELAEFFTGKTSGILIADELLRITAQGPFGREPPGHAFFTPPQL